MLSERQKFKSVFLLKIYTTKFLKKQKYDIFDFQFVYFAFAQKGHGIVLNSH
jgi:hypothetical protein